jgi:hypothetical protein
MTAEQVPRSNARLRLWGRHFLQQLSFWFSFSTENQTLRKSVRTAMKTTEKDKAFWPSALQIEKLREELRRTISHEELESSWRLEALDRIFTDLQMEPATFQRLWIQPLLDAGLSLEAAIAGIAQSHFQPN